MNSRYILGAVIWLFACGSINAQTADDFNPGASSYVYALAVQTDGKILVGGSFTVLGGQTRNLIGRLNADGSLDQDFNPGATQGTVPAVYCLAVQPDGKILVAGTFSYLGGRPCDYIGRLNADGSRDNGFISGANGQLRCLTVQADGKILAGGYFTSLGPPVPPGFPSQTNIGRLNADGSLDGSFNPGAQGTSPGATDVDCLAVQPDGKILVGGSFIILGGQARTNIGRLNANGSLDSGFNPGANARVNCLAVQADGKILVGGDFSRLGGQSRAAIGRLNTDGSLDGTFNPGANNSIYSLAVQADGKILVGGAFSSLGGQTRNHIGRLGTDGSLDSSFNPGAGSGISQLVYSLAVQADGKVLVGGSFTTLGGQSRGNIGRLNSTGPAVQELSYDGSNLLWRRSGTGPEVWRTTFEISTNGVNWIFKIAGNRVAEGWQSPILALSTNSIVRARGLTTAGYRSASSWLVETFWYASPRLSLAKSTNGIFPLTVLGNDGQILELLTATNLSGPWSPTQSFILTNSPATLLWTNQFETERYFRVHSQ